MRTEAKKNIANAGIVVFSIMLAVGLFTYFGGATLARSLGMTYNRHMGLDFIDTYGMDMACSKVIPSNDIEVSGIEMLARGTILEEFGVPFTYRFRMAIYDSSYNLVAETEEICTAATRDPKWFTFNFPGNVTLAKGNKYWVSFWVSNYNAYFYYTLSDDSHHFFGAKLHYTGSFPSNLASASGVSLSSCRDWEMVFNLIAQPVTPPQRILNVNVSPSGAGAVSVNPPENTFEEGTEVTLTASPASGYEFVYWIGDASGTSNPITVTMDSDKTITAHFKEIIPPTYGLTTSVYPSGAGYVEPSSGTYDGGIEVSITAHAYPNYEFDHWSGDASGTSTTITVTMNSDEHITANFVETPLGETCTLTTEVTRGEGTITPSSGTYDSGEKVTIEAIPADGYSFHYWGGDWSGSQNPTVITMNSDKQITASFDEIKPNFVTLIMRSAPPEGGTISITMEVLPMGPAAFPQGTEVTIEAFPNSGYRFDCWSGDASGESKSVTLLMDRDKTVVANFEEAEEIASSPSLLAVMFGSIGLIGSVAGRFLYGR